jgi:cell division septal protein FtsQ
MVQERNILDLGKRKDAMQARKTAATRRPTSYAVERVEAKRATAQKRRWKLRMFAAPVLALLVVGALWGISEASYLPRFTIASVSVEGTKRLPAKLVRSFVETNLYDGTRPIISRTTPFTYHPEQLAAAVEAFFPRVRSAEVVHGVPVADAILVRVEEREPFARWCPSRGQSATSTEETSEGACYVLDDGGFIFAPIDAETAPQTRYVFTGGITSDRQIIGQRYAGTRLPNIVALVRALEQDGLHPSNVSVGDNTDFSIRLDEGFVIQSSFGQNTRDVARNLEVVLSSEALQGKQEDLEYVDLRFGNRVYYRFRSDAPNVSRYE